MSRPLYVQIAEDLRNGILSGEYQPKDLLPSENVLAARYSTSRMTVRKSMSVLENEGLIKPIHGKGYYVLPPDHTMFSMVFSENPLDGHFRYLEVNMISPEEDVARLLQLEGRRLTIVIRRVLERDGQLVAYDEKYVPYERGVPSIEFEIHYAEFPQMFEKRFVPLSLHTEMSIALEKAPERVCAALGIEPGEKLMVISRLICTKDEKPVGFSRQYCTEGYGSLRAQSGYYIHRGL
ncbi:MAG: GntR family transcriptional regulator [Oscillospiraceae bacterium]|jgi:GntR family transcriptional regulator